MRDQNQRRDWKTTDFAAAQQRQAVLIEAGNIFAASSPASSPKSVLFPLPEGHIMAATTRNIKVDALGETRDYDRAAYGCVLTGYVTHRPYVSN